MPLRGRQQRQTVAVEHGTAVESIEFVKLSELPAHGFSERFGQLAMQGFPGAGSYMGAKANIGL